MIAAIIAAGLALLGGAAWTYWDSPRELLDVLYSAALVGVVAFEVAREVSVAEWPISGDMLGENTRSGAVDASTEFITEMIPAVEKSTKQPDMTEELAEILSTSKVSLTYRVESGVEIED